MEPEPKPFFLPRIRFIDKIILHQSYFRMLEMRTPFFVVYVVSRALAAVASGDDGWEGIM